MPMADGSFRATLQKCAFGCYETFRFARNFDSTVKEWTDGLHHHYNDVIHPQLQWICVSITEYTMLCCESHCETILEWLAGQIILALENVGKEIKKYVCVTERNNEYS